VLHYNGLFILGSDGRILLTVDDNDWVRVAMDYELEHLEEIGCVEKG